MVRTIVANFNGITMAYLMGLVNALLALLLAFGVPLTDTQDAAIVSFANAAMIVVAHLGHRLGEQTQANYAAANPADPTGHETAATSPVSTT